MNEKANPKYKPTLLELQGVCDTISSKMDHSRSSGRTVSKKTNNWASNIDHPCERNLTYSRSHWRDCQLPSVETEYIFEEGRDGEKKLKAMIEEQGYEIILAQKYFNWDKYEIAGMTDGFLKFKIPGQTFSSQAPLEIKTVATHSFNKMKTIEEIKSSRSYWIRKAVAQLNTYLLMAGYEYGFLALKTYRLRPRILPMLLDYELGEKCIKKCERVNHYVAKGILPDRILYDSLICDLCPFDHKCVPVKTSKYPDQVDEQTVKDLIKWKKLQYVGSEFKRLDSGLRKRLKGQNAIIEGVEISTSEYETTVYNYPEEYKEIYGSKEPRTRVTMEIVEEGNHGTV